MQVRLTESRDSLPLDRAQWNGLAAQNATHSAFQTFEWFDTWWTAFGPRHRLFLLTIHQAGSIIGIVPLMAVRGPLGLRQLEFIGTPNADYQDLIIPERRDEAVRAVCEFLHGVRGRWDMIVLRNLPSGSPTIGVLQTACAQLGLRLMDMERQPCPTLQIRGREEEVRQLLDRYSVRRSIRRLATRGALAYRTLDTPEEVGHWLPVFFEQHVRRWQGTNDPSPFTDEAFCAWYRDLAQAALAGGWLHFSLLECGGQPAAFHFGFSHGGVLSWYKPSFSPEFARESPGTALISRLIQDATDRGLGELDFAAGLEPFKDRFSNLRRECLNLRIFSGPLLHAGFVAGGRLRRCARSSWHRVRGKSRDDAG